MKILLFLFLTAFLFAQNYVSVAINDPVYPLLEHLELKGALHNLAQARPYSRAQIKKYLQDVLTKSKASLSEDEKRIVQATLSRLFPSEDVAENANSNYLRTGSVSLSDNPMFPLFFKTQLENEQRFALDKRQNKGDLDVSFHSKTLLNLSFFGDIGEVFSYKVLGGLGPMLTDSTTYLPYTFSKERDGHTLGVSQKDNKHVFESDGWSLGLKFGSEMNVSIADVALIGFNYYRRDYGVGEGNLSYSANARPAFGLDVRFRPVNWLGVNFSSVSLGGHNSGSSKDNSSEGAMLSVQQLELFPTDWLYLGLTSSVVWAKRFEPMYVVPLWPVLFTQMITGDYDNLGLETTAAIRFKLLTHWKLYGSFFVDEVQPQAIEKLFSDVKQQFAFQAGLKMLLPEIPFSSVLVQWTRVEPYAYTHYAQRDPAATPKDGPGRLNVSWMHDGENLGYPLQPNSNEVQLRLESMPFVNWRFHLVYRLIHHGDGDASKGEVEGRTDSVYQKTKDGSPTSSSDATANRRDTGIYDTDHYFNSHEVKKDFLSDAPYEIIHSVAIGFEHFFQNLPLSVGFEYGFSYNNGAVYAGNKDVANLQQIMALNFTLFP